MKTNYGMQKWGMGKGNNVERRGVFKWGKGKEGERRKCGNGGMG